LILGNRIIDTRSEWRTFANSEETGEDPNRVGAAQNEILGSDLLDSTIISKNRGSKDMIRHLSMAHDRATKMKEETHLLRIFRDITGMVDRLGANKLVGDSAKQMFKRAQEDKLLKSRSSEAVIAACIYIACRTNGVDRTFLEICDLFKLSKKEVSHCYKHLRKLLQEPLHGISLDSIITRYGSYLDTDKETLRVTRLFIQKVKDIGILDGKNPNTIVASCFYVILSMLNVPNAGKKISDIAGMTESTIKNAYKTLYTHRLKLLTDDLRMTSSMKADLLPIPAGFSDDRPKIGGMVGSSEANEDRSKNGAILDSSVNA